MEGKPRVTIRISTGGQKISPAERPRLYFIDNVRILLVILVVSYHAGRPYAGVPWFIIPTETTELSEVMLGWFLVVCAAFFMGFFFLISGYFAPGSFDRKGVALFLKDRLVRLGIPLVVFSLVVMPLFCNFMYFLDSHDPLSPWDLVASIYHWEPYHLWFVGILLIFAVLYSIWRSLAGGNRRKKLGIPQNGEIFMAVMFLTTATFVIRIWVPIGVWDPLKMLPLAYLPQFLGLYSLGVMCYRQNWLLKLHSSVGMTWLRVGVAAVLSFPILYIVSEGQFSSLLGGFHWRPFIFALWEAFVCIGLCIGLLVYCCEKINDQGSLGRVLSANSYGIYLVHVPVVIFAQYILIGVALHPLLKFSLVTVGGLLVSLLITQYMRKLLFSKKIL